MAAPRKIRNLVERSDRNLEARPSGPVEAALLEEIEGWRELLAENLALRNRTITESELNFAVQATIVRIIFLRMCEDRGIEPSGQLQRLLGEDDLYKELVKLFRKADDRYNSGLCRFHEENGRSGAPDLLTPRLAIDDKVLKHILRRLYYPESPYEFALISSEILGRVYEHFLGKVIRLSGARQAKVEDTPEVKKAGGVYYTPTGIVDCIIEHTVGNLLDGKTPRQVSKLRVLDPACGAGAFLLRACDRLFEWHCQQYLADGPAKHSKKLFQTVGGAWRLTSAEKKRILLDNIFGVDIDPRAVEVTKLALLLKVLEGESEQTRAGQQPLVHERALPDLGGNIKCGNSLLGPDFCQGQPMTLFDEGEGRRLNVFDWSTEFPEILQAGGFHAVIGNPPWGQKAVNEDEAVKRYLWKTYRSSAGIFDLFRPFVERGIQLLAPGGAFGMVLPDIVLLKDYPDTRRYLLEQLSLERIDWWGMAFPGAVIDAATIIGRKQRAPASQCVCATVHDERAPFSHTIPQADFWGNPRFVFNLHLTPETRRLVGRLQEGPTLGEWFEVHEGVHSGNIREELFVSAKEDETCRELYFGRGELAPYYLSWEGRYLRLAALPKNKTRQRYANLGAPEWHEREKVLVRRTGDHVLAAVDRARRFASNNFFLVFAKRECWLTLDGLCALLNSRFMTWYFRAIEPRRGRVFAELKIKHLTSFPLPGDETGCQDLNRLGAERTALAAKLATAEIPGAVAVLERAASHLDLEIEEMVNDRLAIPNNRAARDGPRGA